MHKDTIAVAAAEPGKRGEVREYGKVANTPIALRTMVGRLTCDGGTLRFCHGAGPCGYGIRRQLTTAGHERVVVAPLLSGVSGATGSRLIDAIRSTSPSCVARELTPVWVPEHEAVHDLVRARQGAVRSVRQARQLCIGLEQGL